jgi:hypothetical protein
MSEDQKFREFMKSVISGTFNESTASPKEIAVAQRIRGTRMRIDGQNFNLFNVLRSLDSSATAPLVDAAIEQSNSGGRAHMVSMKNEVTALLTSETNAEKEAKAAKNAEELLKQIEEEQESEAARQHKKKLKKAAQHARKALASPGGGGNELDEDDIGRALRFSAARQARSALADYDSDDEIAPPPSGFLGLGRGTRPNGSLFFNN